MVQKNKILFYNETDLSDRLIDNLFVLKKWSNHIHKHIYICLCILFDHFFQFSSRKEVYEYIHIYICYLSRTKLRWNIQFSTIKVDKFLSRLIAHVIWKSKCKFRPNNCWLMAALYKEGAACNADKRTGDKIKGESLLWSGPETKPHIHHEILS